MDDYKLTIAKALSSAAQLDVQEIESMIEQPPSPDMGDYAFPCFKLAKTLRKAPPMIAQDIKNALEVPGFIREVQVQGAYINFFMDGEKLAEEVVSRVIREGKSYGSSDMGGNKNVCLEYSSINIAKPFHIGHLSTTVIGNSLVRIYKHLGYNVISINHLGDWGTQFGKLIVAYKLWGDRERVEKGSVMELMDLYVRYHDEVEKHPEMDDEAREWFRRIEEHDPEATELFQWFTDLTLKNVQRVYDLLGVKFDSYAGESFYSPMIPKTVETLREKGLLKHDDGAYIVDLSEHNMPPCLILKRDGASLYATRDITAAIYRKETYDFCKLLYVVAYQQDLHFRQFFKVLELMGNDWVKDCEHVSFGMVSLEDGTLSTRRGKVVILEDVLNAAIEHARKIMHEKSPDLDNIDEVARQVGVGAVIWSPLYNNRIKDVVFSWDRALNFEGETGPYAQYTHARCCSVLKKAGYYGREEELLSGITGSVLSDAETTALIKSIAALPEAIKSAAEKNEPYFIARRVIDICSCFNRFYYDHRIMGESPEVERSRLALCAATKYAVQVGLYLLGLDAPDRM